MNDKKYWINELSTHVDTNKKKIQIGIYAVCLTGLTYVARSIRPFQKFRHANNIPKSFIDRKISLYGSVLRIDVESNVLLRIDHKPVLASSLRRRSDPGLAVKISSVNISGNGVSWLQHMLLSQSVRFTLLKKEGDCINCIVRLKDNIVAEELLKLGFATVDTMDFELEKDKIYTKYYQRLLKLENKAEKQRVGVWSTSERTMFEKVKEKCTDITRMCRIFNRVLFKVFNR